MDLSTCRWDAELCRLFGVPVDALPEIVPTTGDLGLLACGGRRVPLAASVVDQQASLYGHGARAAGGAKITFGTGAFCLAVTGHEVPVADGPLPTVAWQKAGEAPTYALDGGVYCASSAVDWARGLGLFAGYDGIGDFGDRPPAIARGLAFVPALAGLACPHWNRAARGAWLGLSLDTAPSDMMQALLEGVALRTAEVVAAMGAVRPLSDPISVDGGMTANPYFLVILADVLGRTIAVSGQPELTAVGTAALAADAIGRPFPLPRPSVAVAPSGCDTAGWTATFSAARRAVESFGR
jgi:glycerol kinase